MFLLYFNSSNAKWELLKIFYELAISPLSKWLYIYSDILNNNIFMILFMKKYLWLALFVVIITLKSLRFYFRLIFDLFWFTIHQSEWLAALLS